MKTKLIKIGALVATFILIFTVAVLPTFAQVNDALAPNMILVWDSVPMNPAPSSADYSTYYEFGFYDARGYYCKAMELNYRSSDGFNIRYVYDDVRVSGTQEVFNDGSGRDDYYWAPYAKYITLVSLPADSQFIAYLQANMSISKGATFSEGYDSGYTAGYDKGKAEGYDEGFDAGVGATESESFGKNLLGTTLNAPIDALNQFVLFESDGKAVTLGGVVGAMLALSIFVLFLKMFAGG